MSCFYKVNGCDYKLLINVVLVIFLGVRGWVELLSHVPQRAATATFHGVAKCARHMTG